MNIRAMSDLIHKREQEEKKDKKYKRSGLRGKSICFTGTLKRFSRAGIKKHVKKAGAIYKSNVTYEVDMLVVGTMKSQTAKYSRAKVYGIDIISEDRFYKLMKLPKAGGFVE